MNINKKLNCVLLHGWGVSNTIWKNFSHKLIKFDEVFLPSLYDFSTTLDSNDLESVARTLSKKMESNSVVIAWSISGLVALTLTRLTRNVKAIIFIASTPCFVNKKGWLNVISRNNLGELKNKGSENMADALKYFAGLVAYGDKKPLVTNKFIRKNLAKEKQNKILSCWLEELETIDRREELSSLEVPSHFILGQNDILNKSNIQNDIKKLNSNIRCSVIKDGGHAPFISKPQETYNIIDNFLNERITY